MEITVKITKVCEKQTYVSQKNGNTYVSIIFIGETTGEYPRRIAFKVMGEERFNQMGIVVGGTYNISFDVESREWNGRYFTDCQAWKAVRTDTTNAPTQAPIPPSKTTPIPQPASQPASTPAKNDNNNDGLPF